MGFLKKSSRVVCFVLLLDISTSWEGFYFLTDGGDYDEVGIYFSIKGYEIAIGIISSICLIGECSSIIYSSTFAVSVLVSVPPKTCIWFSTVSKINPLFYVGV